MPRSHPSRTRPTLRSPRSRRFLGAVVAVVLVASCGGGGGAGRGGGGRANSAASSLVSIGAGLRGPSGIVAATYAKDLTHASAFAFDDQGRLWVATAAYADDGSDGVYLVSAAGAPPEPVITGVHTPLGLLWHGGELYVSSKGHVDAYGGFDGTGFASSRTVLSFPDGTGEDNGLASTPDGRIVLGISAPCDACTPTADYSATVVSFLPDGSGLQVVATGIRAAVGLVYAPGTSDLYVTMNQRDDLGAAAPGDWLSIVRAGQNWGFPTCYGQNGSGCTDEPNPVAVLDPHAAVSGVAIVSGDLAERLGSSAVVAEWAKSKVQRVSLDGSATGTVQPFLAGLKSPEPVITGPDGTLYVGDWATGAIYRITAA